MNEKGSDCMYKGTYNHFPRSLLLLVNFSSSQILKMLNFFGKEEFERSSLILLNLIDCRRLFRK